MFSNSRKSEDLKEVLPGFRLLPYHRAVRPVPATPEDNVSNVSTGEESIVFGGTEHIHTEAGTNPTGLTSMRWLLPVNQDSQNPPWVLPPGSGCQVLPVGQNTESELGPKLKPGPVPSASHPQSGLWVLVSAGGLTELLLMRRRSGPRLYY